MSQSLPAGRARARRIAMFEQALERWGNKKRELLEQQLALRGKVINSPSQAVGLISGEFHQIRRELAECEFLTPIYISELKRLKKERLKDQE